MSETYSTPPSPVLLPKLFFVFYIFSSRLRHIVFILSPSLIFLRIRFFFNFLSTRTKRQNIYDEVVEDFYDQTTLRLVQQTELVYLTLDILTKREIEFITYTDFYFHFLQFCSLFFLLLFFLYPLCFHLFFYLYFKVFESPAMKQSLFCCIKLMCLTLSNRFPIELDALLMSMSLVKRFSVLVFFAYFVLYIVAVQGREG